jgi:hypothetical protein
MRQRTYGLRTPSLRATPCGTTSQEESTGLRLERLIQRLATYPGAVVGVIRLELYVSGNTMHRKRAALLLCRHAAAQCSPYMYSQYDLN